MSKPVTFHVKAILLCLLWLLVPFLVWAEPAERKEAFHMGALSEFPDEIPLPELIHELSGYEVFDWEGSARDWLVTVGERVLEEANREPISARRVNEVGNRVENLVLKVMEELGGDCRRPSGPSGRVKAAGYPDLWMESEGLDAYVELKTFSAHTQRSSQRTFYVSPSDDFKVTRNAYHLLLAFSTRKVGENLYELVDFYWVDLYHLNCRVKVEFNASNRDMYQEEGDMVIASSKEEE